MPLPLKHHRCCRTCSSRANPSADIFYSPALSIRAPCEVINSHLKLSMRVLTILIRHVARLGCQRDLSCRVDVRLLVISLSCLRGLGGRRYLCNSYIVSFLICDSTPQALLPAVKAGQLPYPVVARGGQLKVRFWGAISLDPMNHEPPSC